MSSDIEVNSRFGDVAAAPAVLDRITGLDVTRGFAVMGILLMNIVAFAMPENAYISPRAWGGDTGVDLWTWAVNFVVADSKMRGLFSMMFGASTLLVINSAVVAGRSPARTHYGRMIVLALFGLAHYFLVWFGDILFSYAMCGMLLYAFRNLSLMALRRWAIGFFILAIAFASLQFGILALADRPGMPADLQAAATDLQETFANRSAASTEQVELYQSGWGTIVAHAVGDKWEMPLVGLIMYGPETIALMLVGMIMFKSGLLQGRWSLERLDRWRNRCLGIGLVANLVLLWWQLSSGLDPITLLLASFWASIPFDFIMSVGYAALFMGLAQRYATSPFIARVAATGRAAFTNYLGTSIMMTFIFYGWGLGLFGTVNRAPLYLFVLGAWAVMLLWSKPWLDRFRYGPLEWLWRSLARGQMQPMRK